MTLPGRYGTSMGPYRPIPLEKQTIDFSRALGLRLDKSPHNLEEGESYLVAGTESLDGCRLSSGLLLADGYSNTGMVLPDSALHLTTFRTQLASYLIAIRDTRWSYAVGPGFAAVNIGGVTSSAWDDPIYSVSVQGKLVGAVSPLDRLWYWDGVIANPLQPLSADAPKAKFIATIGNRLVAAGISDVSGNGWDPNLLAWSEDGNIQGWTDGDKGAGALALLPESGDYGSDEIVGLSTHTIGLIIYRRNSIVIASRTGIGGQPFRFTTLVSGLGPVILETSKGAAYGRRIGAIVHAGPALGDIFIGNDSNVYLFNPPNRPVPIGEPIKLYLRSHPIPLPIAGYDAPSSEYILSRFPVRSFVFDVGQYIATEKLVWRSSALHSNSVTFGISNVANAEGLLITDVAGTTVSRVLRPENGPAVHNGASTWVSRVLGSVSEFLTLHSARIPYVLEGNLGIGGASNWTVTLYVSTDYGITWVNVGSVVLATVKGVMAFPINMRVSDWQFRIDISKTATAVNPQATLRIPKLEYWIDRRGRL